jgi:DNA-binding PadR family transcriptional regulator
MGMDRERRAEPQGPLRPVEFHILLSLAAGERHGYGIIQDVEGRGESVDVGTLYRALARMTDQGLIGASGRRGAADAANERRHYYHITARGLRLAEAEARRVVALAKAARLSGLLKGATT